MTKKTIVKFVATAAAVGIGLFALAQMGYAADAKDIGGVADNVTKTMGALAKLINAVAMVAGMGFGIAAILKFKQHKDNPTQIPVGTPIALLFIAAALLFLPNLFSTMGKTLFGADKSDNNVSGTNEWTSGGGGGGQ